MRYSKKIVICHKKLMRYREEKAHEADQYEKGIERANCIRCRRYFGGAVNKISERHLHCGDCAYADNLKRIADQEEEYRIKIQEFIENEYAREVYSFFSPISPMLIRRADGSIHPWTEDYGCEFDMIPELLRHSLVGLVEGTGKYKLLEEDLHI